MAEDLNAVFLTGRMTKDAILKQIPNGSYVSNFSIANNRPNKKQGEQWIKQPPFFFNCVLWGRLAEVLKQYMTKGTQVTVQGHLQTRQYTATGESKPRYVTEVVVESIVLGQRPGAENGGQGFEPAGDSGSYRPASMQPRPPQDPDQGDDLPEDIEPGPQQAARPADFQGSAAAHPDAATEAAAQAGLTPADESNTQGGQPNYDDEIPF